MVGTFDEKEFHKRVYGFKRNKQKSDEIYVKWKGYDNSFNKWIDKKDIFIQNKFLSRIRYSH